MTEAPGIDILNCGAGHNELLIDKDNPVELERAKRIIGDMLRRGYVLFVTDEGGALRRVESFDPERAVYIIGDGPLYAGDEAEAARERAGRVQAENALANAEEELRQTPEPEPAPAKRGPGRPRKTEVPMTATRATAIGRSAGG